MNRQPQGKWNRSWRCRVTGAFLFAAGIAGSAEAQSLTAPIPPPALMPQISAPVQTNYLQAKLLPVKAEAAPGHSIPAGSPAFTVQAVSLQNGDEIPPPKKEIIEPIPETVNTGLGCASGGCRSGGCGGCIPGRFRDCCWCNSDTFGGRLLCNLYDELCCPDPCYEGKWIPAANAAFFVEGTRPVTTTRIRWDSLNDFTQPDRSEFFWARSGGGGKGPPKIDTGIRVNTLSLYQEIATKGFSVFFETPYSSIDPEVNKHASGFGDLRIGTKSLLFDRDLFQVGFMFTTYLPVGNFGKGLGTGHVSLEPSLLGTLKISPTTFLQSQLSEWIPIAGDPAYAGSILHYHVSLNQVLCHPLAPDVQLIGTLEFSGYSFQDGLYSDPGLGQFQRSSGGSWLSAGPGLRLVICDWLDFGVGSAFALGNHGPGQTYRTEFRIRF